MCSTTSSKAKSHPTQSLRSGIRAENMVHDESDRRIDMKAEDVVKIFTADDEYVEVTHEQAERVKTMHRKIADGVNFSFNFNVLLFVSSILAALGLVSDNGATIIASMLVSPLMGPVVGLAYGSTICDWKLVRRSLRNEGICLLFCVAIGMIVGGICGNISWIVDEWPTSEMATRCTWANVIIALPVAFISGLGVAVSLFDDQMASLVGVAISASLLPPAVNSGIVWISHLFTAAEDIPQATKYASVSMCLTISNIILIWISSMLMFRMKEVLPIKKSIFWSDLGIARKLYQKKALIQLYKVNPSDGTRTLVERTKDPMSEEDCAATIFTAADDDEEAIEVDIESCLPRE